MASGINYPPSNAVTDPYGNYLPRNQYRGGIGFAPQATPADAGLARVALDREQFNQQQADKERAFGDQLPATGSAASAPAASAPPSSSNNLFGGFNLGDALKALLGASTDTTTTVADMSQAKQGLADILGPIISALGVSQNSLLGSLANTGMSGKVGLTNAAVDAGKANQSSKLAADLDNARRAEYAGKQALFQGLIGSRVGLPTPSQVSSSSIDIPSTDVDLTSFFGGGGASTGPGMNSLQGGAPQSAPPPSTRPSALSGQEMSEFEAALTYGDSAARPSVLSGPEMAKKVMRPNKGVRDFRSMIPAMA